MRPGRGAEGDREVRLVAQARREAIGGADDEDDGGHVLRAPPLQAAGEGGAAHALAALIEDHRDGAVGNDIGDGDRFLEHAPGGIPGAALFDLDDIEGAQSRAATGIGRALAIALRELTLGALLQPADDGHHDPHARRYAWNVEPLKPSP